MSIEDRFGEEAEDNRSNRGVLTLPPGDLTILRLRAVSKLPVVATWMKLKQLVRLFQLHPSRFPLARAARKHYSPGALWQVASAECRDGSEM